MIIIAISGWKRSGKDTVSEYLTKEFGFTRVSFADPLKDMVAEEYNIPRSYCDDPRYKEAPILKLPAVPKDEFTRKIQDMLKAEIKNGYWTPRALCILKGSINRAVDSSYWVKKTIDKIRSFRAYDSAANDLWPTEAKDLTNKFVISDLRYRSEVEQLKNVFGNGLITIRVNRFDNISTTDPSERDLDDFKFDYTIENKEDLESLFIKVKGVMKNVGCK